MREATCNMPIWIRAIITEGTTYGISSHFYIYLTDIGDILLMIPDTFCTKLIQDLFITLIYKLNISWNCFLMWNMIIFAEISLCFQYTLIFKCQSKFPGLSSQTASITGPTYIFFVINSFFF